MRQAFALLMLAACAAPAAVAAAAAAASGARPRAPPTAVPGGGSDDGVDPGLGEDVPVGGGGPRRAWLCRPDLRRAGPGDERDVFARGAAGGLPVRRPGRRARRRRAVELPG